MDLTTAALIALVCVCIGVVLESAAVMMRRWCDQGPTPTLAALARQIRALEVAVVRVGRTMALSLDALRAAVEQNDSRTFA